jgi:hypothetical protein
MYFAQINSKNTLVDIDQSNLTEDEYGSSDVQNIEVSEEIYNNAQQYGSNYYIYSNGEIILNPNYEQEKVQKRQVKFETEFFNTSLGWIRRKVTMKDGSTKDFLSDLLPSIMEGLRLGIAPNIITYREPDFTQEVTDWTVYQVKKEATQQFIQDCLLQISEDFGAI